MKKLSVSALALAAVLAAPALAHADQTPGWYVGAGAGVVLTPDSITNTPASDHNTLGYSPGWSINGAGGYAFSNGLRLEGEAFTSRADISSIKGGTSAGGHGHLNNTDLFANAYYDFHTGTIWTPYVGAGIGIGFPGATNIGNLNNGGSLNDSTTEFAYQAIAGLAAQLDPNWALTADYRYIGTTDPSFSTTAGGHASTDNQSHNIIFGVRYSFGNPAPVAQAAPAPRPMAHAAAKPAVAPVPQSYMVFFDFDKSTITPEAQRILASAAEDYKNGGTVRIVVTGHTDTVGTASYNQGLSVRRANAVKEALSSLGVPANVVTAKGVGKNGLLVPTADGVREAQNRRAEIVFDKQ